MTFRSEDNMSTRITIACGEDWHFYWEAFEEGGAWLEIGDERIFISDDVWSAIRNKVIALGGQQGG